MSRNDERGESSPGDAEEIETVYRRMLDAWNQQDSDAMADAFVKDGVIIGFDGSEHVGQDRIAADMSVIFGDHQTATYVAKVKGVRMLTPNAAILRSVAGMIPPEQADLNPEANVIHTVVVFKQDDQWKIVQYQNTPAQYHGRPEAREALTEELQAFHSTAE